MTARDRVSPHLAWSELACWNRLRDAAGRSVPFHGIPPGYLVAPYPLDLRERFGARLGAVHEAIRARVSAALGCETPLVVSSAYRTPEYDRAVGGRSNWHPKAGAMDYPTPRGLTVVQFYDLVLGLALEEIGDLGGVGLYTWGVHVDLRPRGKGELARWDYRPASVRAREPLGAAVPAAEAPGS